MTQPTPEQLNTAISNLHTLQALNDYAYPHGLARISDAFDLLTQPDDSSNAGLTVVLNILEGAFWGIGASVDKAYTEIANFSASFLSGMVSYWATGSAPPDLNVQFVNFRDAYSKSSEALDTQLAGYHEQLKSTDPEVVQTCWNTQFSYNGKTTTVSDLALKLLPQEKNDPNFVAMAHNISFGLAQALWKKLLVDNFWITQWLEAPQEKIAGNDPDSPPYATIQAYIKANPAYYYTWDWHPKKGKCDASGWLISMYSLGDKIASEYHDNALRANVCAYLFQDSTDGTIINSDGLFPRKTVFTELGIRQEGYSPVYSGSAIATAVSSDYLKADQQGNTLPALVESQGRAAIEQRVIQKAQEDAVFAQRLAKYPRQTLEEFLEVKIPETLSLSIVIENPQHYGLVVPMADKEQ